jgi:hypothetical protein
MQIGHVHLGAAAQQRLDHGAAERAGAAGHDDVTTLEIHDL